jgi:tRNA modification GTPase
MTGGEATRVVQLTPSGRGAVTTLLVEGPAAVAIVNALFHAANGRPIGREPARKILFGRWKSAEVGEEVVVCRQDDAHVEVHCHGGDAAAQALIASLVGRGCQQIGWTDWVSRAEPDAIAAAAMVALSQASTARTAAILWDQYHGALRAALNGLSRMLAAGDANACAGGLAGLLQWLALGRHLTEPWKVVLAGPPNVGKSSLINALLGFDRVIVHDTPGTTRDVVATLTAIDGWPVELTDTAGLHASDDPLEAAGIERARQQFATADLVVLVSDCGGASEIDLALPPSQHPAALRAWSKCDLNPLAFLQTDGIRTSAKTGEGLEALRRAIAQALVPHDPSPDQAVPFTSGVIDALEQALRMLAEGQESEAARILAQLAVAAP